MSQDRRRFRRPAGQAGRRWPGLGRCGLAAALGAALLCWSTPAPAGADEVGECSQIAAGGCPLDLDQPVVARLEGPQEVHQWQVLVEMPGRLDVSVAGNANIRVDRADRSTVSEAVSQETAQGQRLAVPVDPGFYQVQLTGKSDVSADPYRLMASLTPNLTPGAGPVARPMPAPPACAVPLVGGFGKLYAADARVRARLGCPLAPESAVVLAEEAFQRGHMVWRADTRQIVVMFGDGGSASYPDLYDGGPLDRREPPPGLWAPVRGFGNLWREQPDLVNSLGWALGPEQGLSGAVQDFQRGVMLWMGDGQWLIRIIYKDQEGGALVGGALVVHDPARPR